MTRPVSWFCKIFIKPFIDALLVKEVRGLENVPKSNFILASNHQSHLDWIISGYVCLPRRFTYIGQVDRYKGLLGLGRNILYFIAGVIPINRKDDESKKKAINEAIRALKRGDSLVIYPEGTRSRSGEIAEGKLGAAKIYLKTGVPILPLGISGTFDLMPAGNSSPKIKRVVELNIGKPLYFTDYFEKAKNLKCDSWEYGEICQKIIDKVMEEIKTLTK